MNSLWALLLAAGLQAASPPPPPPPPVLLEEPAPVSASAASLPLKDGDRIVFMGDSITEFGNYTGPVEAYLTLRYPGVKATFINAGWSGDKLDAAAHRLERDVLALKPTLVTLCYGMNDGFYMKREAWVGELFAKNIGDLIDKIQAAGAKVVLLTPGIVDEENPANAWLKDVDYNKGGLAMLAKEARDLAAKRGIPIFDIHELLGQVQAKALLADSKFNMLPDSIHPDEAGGMVMAYALLKVLGVPERHERLRLDLKTGQAEASAGWQASQPEKSADGSWSFRLKMASLPFFVEPKARKILPYLPWQDDYNRFELAVSGLEGPACLEFGPEATAFMSPADFEKGFRLEERWDLPALKQAEKVLEFTREKTKAYLQLWRNLALRPNFNAWEDYRPEPHRLGIADNEALQGLARSQAQPPAEGYLVTLRPLPVKGELLENGAWLRTVDLSPAIHGDPATLPEGIEVTAVSAQGLTSTAGFWAPRRLNMEKAENNLGFLMPAPGKARAYAAVVLESPLVQKVKLKVGKDDSCQVWLNGRSVYQSVKGGALKADSDVATLSLQRGMNLLLIKVGQGAGAWGLSLRMEGLKKPLRTWPASLAPQPLNQGGKP